MKKSELNECRLWLIAVIYVICTFTRKSFRETLFEVGNLGCMEQIRFCALWLISILVVVIIGYIITEVIVRILKLFKKFV